MFKEFFNVIGQGIREADVFGRFGGEEFAIILQETNLTLAQVLIERLRKKVEPTSIHFGGREIQITVSFGAAQLDIECDSFENSLKKQIVLCTKLKRRDEIR